MGARDDLRIIASAAVPGVCAGDCTDVQSNATGGTGDYEFSWNEGLPAGAGPYRVCPRASTEYVVTVTAVSGKEIRTSATASVTVDVHDCTTGSSPGAGGMASLGGGVGTSPTGAAGLSPSPGGVSSSGAGGTSAGGASSGGAGGASVIDEPPHAATILCQAKLGLAPELNGGSGQFGRDGGDTMYKSPHLATDAAGDMIVTGSFDGTIDTGVGMFDARGSDWAGFVVKFTPDCEPSWARVYGAPGARVDFGPVAVTSTGEIVLAGDFSQATVSVDFGAGPLSGPQGIATAFVLKLRPDGTTVFSKAYAVASQQFSYVNGLALDGADDIILMGEASDPNAFGGVLIDADLGGNYVAKFEPDGTPLWTRLCPRFALLEEMHVAPTGITYLVGWSTSSQQGLDWGNGDVLGPSASDFITELDSTGAHRWSRPITSGNGDWGSTADVDGSENAIVTYGNRSTSDPETTTRTLRTLATDGTWSAPVTWDSEASASYAGWVRVTGSGHTIEAGTLTASMHVGGNLLAVSGETDMYIVERDGSGRAIWSDRLGGTDRDVPLGLATDAQGNGIAFYFTDRDQSDEAFLVKYAR